MNYDIVSDLLLVKRIKDFTDQELADSLRVSRSTLNRWIKGESKTSFRSIVDFYEFVEELGIKINDIKVQFLKEENKLLLFHGAKKDIAFPLSLTYSRKENDYGVGFYCGESLEQSAMYTAGYSDSSVYVFTAEIKDLDIIEFDVDVEWMITIAYYRGRLKEYENHPLIREIVNKIVKCDCIIAPIADNKMFSLINNFIDGELTDEQCKHCLAATNLGKQYVFRTEKGLSTLKPLSHLFLTKKEKESYLSIRQEDIRIGNDKVKAARAKYAGKGKYIFDILK